LWVKFPYQDESTTKKKQKKANAHAKEKTKNEEGEMMGDGYDAVSQYVQSVLCAMSTRKRMMRGIYTIKNG
jgi:hypothetical protein